MHSARLHPSVVNAYIQSEVGEERIAGPFPPGCIPELHINPMGVIPKGHTPGKWRLITDLSHPEGNSVNDGIEPRLVSISYISVEAVAIAARRLGRGALLAKVDIKAAYRLVPVHPQDRYLLGIEWDGAHYADGLLPFGLRSAPKIFTAVADALEWMMRHRGVAWVAHYLDDFITMGPPASAVCGQNLERIRAVCGDLGVPLAVEKIEGPGSCLTFLGIEMDTQVGVLRLPADKLARVKETLAQWSMRKSCRRRELESLVGTLQHACRVVKPGRAFLRRMIDLLRLPSSHEGPPSHPTKLPVSHRSAMVVHIHGEVERVAMFPSPVQPAFTVTSDASGSWGCGAWSGSSWFQFEWPQPASDDHILFKELLQVYSPARHGESDGGAHESNGIATTRQRCTQSPAGPAVIRQ